MGESKFLASIGIEGIDRHGILHDLTQLISQQLTYDIRSLDIRADKEVFHADMSVLVNDVAEVDALCAKIRKINGIEKVARI